MVSRSSRAFSVLYHDIFDYPLNDADLTRWKSKLKTNRKINLEIKNGYTFLKGRETLIKKREERQKLFSSKTKLAKKSSKLISQVPFVCMVGLTGALAMKNAKRESDIDLLIITKKNRLWLARFLVYIILVINNFKIRKPNDKKEEDKLCLNMWLSEDDLSWNEKDRNVYTAHEIAQIIPLINKSRTYEKFLWENKWLLEFWPDAVSIKKTSPKPPVLNGFGFIFNVLEGILYKLQRLYMTKKITREIITPSKAIFHPVDWGRRVLKKLQST